MIVKDLIEKANIDRQVEIICENRPSYEEPYDKNKVKKVQEYFINMLLSLTPKKEDCIIIFEKYWDSINDDPQESYISPELYHKEDLENYLKSIKDKESPVLEYNENMSGEELKSLCHKFEIFPTAYAFEFVEWEKILGWEVYEGNLKDFDLQECIYYILFEMSFNGITRESQKERFDELNESIKENEELMKLPKEERDKHYISWDEMKEHFKEEFGWEEPTKEEQEENDRLMWLCALKTSIWRFENFKNVYNNIPLLKEV